MILTDRRGLVRLNGCGGLNRAARAMVAEMYASIRPPGTVMVRGLLDYQNERTIRIQIENAARNANEITLAINSPGGYVPVADNIIRDLGQTGRPITARVGLQCASAATSILAAAGWRIGRPETRIYFHQVHASAGDMAGMTAEELREIATEIECADRRYRGYVHGLHMHKRLYDAAVSKEGLELDGRTALVYGILHAIESD